MAKPESTSTSMQQSPGQATDCEQIMGEQGAGRLLQQRLELVEDLWQTVLRSECPPEQTERLLRLKQLSEPLAIEEADGNSTSTAIVLLIREMDLAEAIAAEIGRAHV